MKISSQDSPGKLERPEDLGVREIRACQICGAKFSATGEHEFCPVCMLRKALAGGGESSESLSEDTVRPTPEHAASRFEHYEIVLDKEGNLSSWVAVRWASPTRHLTSICVVQ